MVLHNLVQLRSTHVMSRSRCTEVADIASKEAFVLPGTGGGRADRDRYRIFC